MKMANVIVTGAARFYRAASVLIAMLDLASAAGAAAWCRAEID